jgi:hypothetical protein
MNKSFDDLFNEFFKRSDENPFDKIRENVLKIIESLNNPYEPNLGSSLDSLIENDLGEPNSIEHFEENGLFYERQTWHLPTGNLVKIIISETPNSPSKPEKSLEEQLKDALENEDYILAAKLRDELNPLKKEVKKRGRKKKSDEQA